MRDALPSYLKGLVAFACKTDWRESEISGLTRNRVDRGKGIGRLEVEENKNDGARTSYLDNELKQIIEAKWNLRKENKNLLSYVFTNETRATR